MTEYANGYPDLSTLLGQMGTPATGWGYDTGSPSSGSSGANDYLRQAYEAQAQWARDQLAAQVAQAHATIENQWRIARLQARTEQERMEIDRWYKGEQLKLAQQAQQLDNDKFGLDMVSRLAQMGGPGDYFQAADFAAGMQQRQSTPVFLQNLWNNQPMPAFQQAGGIPIPQSAYTIGNMLGTPPPGQGANYTPGAMAPAAVAPGTMSGPLVSSGAGQGRRGSPLPGAPASYAPSHPGLSPFVGRQPAGPAAPAYLGPPSGGAGVGNPLVSSGLGQGGGALPPAIAGLSGQPSAAYDYGARAQQDANALGAIRDVYARGAHQLAPGVWEGLAQDDQNLVLSGIRKVGGSPTRWLQDLTRSRPGQGSAMAA